MPAHRRVGIVEVTEGMQCRVSKFDLPLWYRGERHNREPVSAHRRVGIAEVGEGMCCWYRLVGM